MTNRLSILLPLLLAAACGSPSSGGKSSRDSKRKPESNSADEATFKDKSRKLLAMLDDAAPIEITSASLSQPAGCPLDGPILSLGVAGLNDRPDGTLALADGDTCERALAELHTHYSHALSSLRAQIQALVDLDKDDFKACGVKASQIEVDQEKAAVAWRFFPSTGEDVRLDVYGSAGEKTVIYDTALESHLDARWEDGGQASDLRASFRAVADLDQSSLRLETAVEDQSAEAQRPTDVDRRHVSFSSTAEITGLGKTKGLVVKESTKLTAKSKGPLRAVDFDGTFDLTVEQIDADKLRLSGAIKSTDEGTRSDSDFTMLLSRTSRGCTVEELSQRLH